MKKMRRWRLAIAVSVVFLLLAGCISPEALARISASQMRSPEIRVVSAQLHTLSFEDAGLEFELAIYNPNPMAVRLDGLRYAFSIDDETVISGTIDEVIDLGPESNATVSVPATVNFHAFEGSVRAFLGEREAPYRMDIEMDFTVPYLGTVTVPVSHEGTVPVIARPGVRITALRLDRLRLDGIDLTLFVTVENRNRFALALERVGYQVVVNGREWISGTVDRPLPVSAEEDAIFELPLRVSAGALGPALRRIVTGSEPLEFVASGEATISADLPLLQDLSMPIALEGSLRL